MNMLVIDFKESFKSSQAWKDTENMVHHEWEVSQMDVARYLLDKKRQMEDFSTIQE